MRSGSPLCFVAALLCWLLPAAVHAQAGQTGQEGYEPDQRGDHDEPDQPSPDQLYEPDQRGNLEGADQETQYDAAIEDEEEAERSEGSADAPPASPGVALTSAEMAAVSETSFALELRLGPAITVFEDTSNVGFAVGLFGGARFGSLALGPRFDLTIDADFVTTAFALEAQLSLTESALQPVLRAAAGYALVSSSADTLHAFHLEAGIGLRWNVSSTLAIGTDVAGVALIPHGWQGRFSLSALLRF